MSEQAKQYLNSNPAIPMVCNLHAHTYRCNHATGTEEEYVQNAIQGGLKTFGFSDHTPMPFPADYYSTFRMHPEQQEGYVTTLLALREKYRDQIDLKIGYEVEYYPRYFNQLLRMLHRFPVDYIIQGQHMLYNEYPDAVYCGISTKDPDFLHTFVSQSCEGMQTGAFTYLAHPDLCDFRGSAVVFEEEYGRLIECANQLGIPLEINLLGIRAKRPYPHEAFFRLAGQMGAEVVIGCDAHAAEDACDLTSYRKALQMIDRFHLKYLPKPGLRPVPESV